MDSFTLLFILKSFEAANSIFRRNAANLPNPRYLSSEMLLHLACQMFIDVSEKRIISVLGLRNKPNKEAKKKKKSEKLSLLTKRSTGVELVLSWLTLCL
jgi:hypothetical protein